MNILPYTVNLTVFPNPFKERLADFIFQTLDLHAHGGLRAVNLPATPGQSLASATAMNVFRKSICSS